MDHDVRETYGNRLRIRVCGLCWRGETLLLVNHEGISEGDFWAPPGGGVHFGESLKNALKREFREETGLEVEVGEFRFGCELLKDPLHSIELFFETTEIGGALKIGSDPEIQIIKDVRFFTVKEIQKTTPSYKHGILRMATHPAEFAKLRGFYRI